MTVHLGKQDATALRSGTVRYADLRGALVKDSAVTLPAYPRRFGHANAFSDWRMLGNGPDDSVFPGFGGAGDCYWAGSAHDLMEAGATSKRPAPSFSGKTVVAQYSAYSGYDPQTGANDNGTNLQDGLAWRQTKGIYDDNGTVYKIGQHVALAPGNLQELWEAAWLFECVGIGVQVQAQQQEQFQSGEAWDYVPGASFVGGHYVPVMGLWHLVSWAARVGFTRSFYVNQNDEAFAWIDSERYSRVTGDTAEGFSDQDLEKYLVLVGRLKSR